MHAQSNVAEGICVSLFVHTYKQPFHLTSFYIISSHILNRQTDRQTYSRSIHFSSPISKWTNKQIVCSYITLYYIISYHTLDSVRMDFMISPLLPFYFIFTINFKKLQLLRKAKKVHRQRLFSHSMNQLCRCLYLYLYLCYICIWCIDIPFSLSLVADGNGSMRISNWRRLGDGLELWGFGSIEVLDIMYEYLGALTLDSGLWTLNFWISTALTVYEMLRLRRALIERWTLDVRRTI